MTRSLVLRIIVVSLGTVFISLAAFLAILGSQRGPSARQLALDSQRSQLAATVEFLRLGHKDAAAANLSRLDRTFRARHALADDRGVDVLTGEDHSPLLRAPYVADGPERVQEGGTLVIHSTADGKYHLIVQFGPIPGPWAAAPYYALILGVIALLSWLLASGVAIPLRTMAAAVRRFGQGDLTVRLASTRPDEIGQLARAFDDMANRLETLLSAERRLLQDISHELRSPLARLAIASELARTSDDREWASGRIQKEVDRLTSLVGSLIEVTRAEGDPAARRNTIIDLREVAEDVVAGCALEAEQRQCRLLLTSGGRCLVTGDRELMHRAIENVVRNAIRYSSTGRMVDIDLAESGSEVHATIRDYGPGVPPDLLPRLAAPFFRVESARDYSPEGGVGLGLSIARRAVELHGGRLVAENAQPGLRVTISVPASP
jgi:signal transduction histidine kinase